jgi:ribosomal protein L39E
VKQKKSASSKLRLIKIPVQAYLEPAQAKALKALSDNTRVPQQVYLREGVDLVLEKHRRGK